MAAESDQPLLRLDLQDIGLLDQGAREIELPTAVVQVYTVCFWFYSEPAPGVRVIANAGNRTLAERGWTVYLEDGMLAFRATVDGEHYRQVECKLTKDQRWRHFTGVFDTATRRVDGYLNGSRTGWKAGDCRELAPPGSVRHNADLTIGGYTDDAGGHFDYRFGAATVGYLDDFRIYPRRLRDREVKAFRASPGKPPVPSLLIDCDSDEAPTTVRFKADNSAGNGPLRACVWDFGDGSRALGNTATHPYRYAGSYDAQLTVIGDDYAQASATRTIRLGGAVNPIHFSSVFENAAEGYACYRIPAIVRALNGDLVAFAEGRVADYSDSTPVIHIVCKRSADNGRTWTPLQVVARNWVDGQEYACMNPAPVVDTVYRTGYIIVVFNKMERNEWAVTCGASVCRVCCIVSHDHGGSWIDERDITAQVHRPYNPDYTAIVPCAAREENRRADWRKQVPTLGHAIQLEGATEDASVRGRLLFIGGRTEGAESVFCTRNYPFWSDDLGMTWQLGDAIAVRDDGTSAKGLGEATAVELTDGSIMINSRNYQEGKVVGYRAVTTAEPDTTGRLRFQPTRHDSELIDSGVQASLIGHLDGDGQVLIFANPSHPKVRRGMTVRVSYDQGTSWPVAKLVDPGPSAYSDLVIQDDNHVGLLYEKGNTGGIAHASIALDWLTAR